jgi:putative ABC transport system permease protein
MKEGTVAAVHHPDTVLVDELYLNALGVEKCGQEFEMIGERAVVGGITDEVRTFTASPYVFTSIESAIRYDKRYRPDEVTYVLARCAKGYTPEQVRDSIARYVPHVEVLTSREFALRTMKYWMLETGVGTTVVVTAVLGLLVGALIMSQTLFAITQEHIANYATLVALGFSRPRLTAIVLVQSLILGGGGIALGSQFFFLASRASATTPIPLETTGPVFAALVAISLASCFLASFASVRSIFRIDPISVFRV